MIVSELVSDPGFPFLFAGILMLPTIVFQIIPIIRGRNTAPFWSFLFSLMLNCGYGFLFGEGKLHKIGVYFIFFSAFFTIIPYSFCFCSTSFQGNHLVLREILDDPLSTSDFMNQICDNRAFPPQISVWCEAYHYKTTVVRNSKGTHNRTTKVVTFKDMKPFPYTSWEEKGTSINVKDATIIHALCSVSFRFDDSAKEGLNEFKNYMKNLAETHDEFSNVGFSRTVPGLKESLVGTLSEQIGCISSFYQSKMGRLLWFVFCAIGYQSSFESIWCQDGERMKVKLIKAISCGDKLRCQYDDVDNEAADNTFIFNDTRIPPNFKQYSESKNSQTQETPGKNNNMGTNDSNRIYSQEDPVKV